MAAPLGEATRRIGSDTQDQRCEDGAWACKLTDHFHLQKWVQHGEDCWNQQDLWASWLLWSVMNWLGAGSLVKLASSHLALLGLHSPYWVCVCVCWPGMSAAWMRSLTTAMAWNVGGAMWQPGNLLVLVVGLELSNAPVNQLYMSPEANGVSRPLGTHHFSAPLFNMMNHPFLL